MEVLEDHLPLLRTLKYSSGLFWQLGYHLSEHAYGYYSTNVIVFCAQLSSKHTLFSFSHTHIFITTLWQTDVVQQSGTKWPCITHWQQHVCCSIAVLCKTLVSRLFTSIVCHCCYKNVRVTEGKQSVFWTQLSAKHDYICAIITVCVLW